MCLLNAPHEFSVACFARALVTRALTAKGVICSLICLLVTALDGIELLRRTASVAEDADVKVSAASIGTDAIDTLNLAASVALKLVTVCFGTAGPSRISTNLAARRKSGGIAREPITGGGIGTLVSGAADLTDGASACLAGKSDRVTSELDSATGTVTNISRAALLTIAATGLTSLGVGITG